MNVEEIKGLMQAFDQSGIHKMTLQLENVVLKMEKECAPGVTLTPAPVALPAAAPVVPSPVVVPEPAPVPTTVAPEPAGIPVKSPVVGTFYRASSPEAEPFVTVGQYVQKGQTLCIIEAMKMMNEITAPVSGKIIRILVNQEEMVEYDQTIMLMKEE